MTDAEHRAFRQRVLALLRSIETDGFDFDGDECKKCGQVDGETCCPSCRTHFGGKLAGPYRHSDDCELAAVMKEARGC